MDAHFMDAYKNAHDLDDDAVCIKCGFDGAEWYHWKKWTYEGRASDAKEPSCPYPSTSQS